MAQALFDEHPLGEYLRDAGESPIIMPGISVQLEQEIDIYYGLLDDGDPELKHSDCYPQILLETYQALQFAISSWNHHPPPRSFVERFKYNIISSSLLSLSLQSSHPTRPPRPLSIPGELHHSRVSSIDLGRPISPTPPSSPDPSYGLISCAAACAAILFSIGYRFLAIAALSAIIFFFYKTISTTETAKSDMTPTLNTLDELVVATDVWDSVVQDALNILESDELSQARGLSSATPPSPIRIALFSCLQTTHTQCDNVRHLFSALTSPPELSQLSEMYAPPSPSASKVAFTTESHPRPFSFPSPRPKYSQQPQLTPENKRSTWNGSYSSLAFAGSPTSSINRRKDNHRAHISDLFKPSVGSAPPTPTPVKHSRDPPPKVSESDNREAGDSQGHLDDFSPSRNYFGTAALDLQRKRKSGGMEAFQTPPPQYFSPDPFSPRSFRHSVFSHPQTSPSKFTNMQPGRHPLSLSALHHTLQGAIAAKRYAASHLLALRFTEEDEEAYWEDVRSVMDLLTTTLVDASTRLSEALDEADQQKLRDQQPTPNTTLFDIEPTGVSADHLSNSHKRRRFDSRASFAPMPSQLSRFAAHVAAISSSLDDAWDHLDQCIAALKNDPDPSSNTPNSPHKLRHSKSFSRALSSIPGAGPESQEHQALQAYERLRRELGLALRECERGRERLLEIVYPPVVNDEDEGLEDLPGLGHDASDESDRPDPTSPFSEDEGDSAPLSNAGRFPPAVTEGEAIPLDDVTAHLLMVTNAQHLPMPGIEEVFEAEPDSKIVFSRERSRLTREERIKIAKVKRESGLGLAIGVGAAGGEGDSNIKMGVERWGPGGEVVQELKDVIWKVGEKRRKMTDSTPGVQSETTTDDSPPSSRS